MLVGGTVIVGGTNAGGGGEWRMREITHTLTTVDWEIFVLKNKHLSHKSVLH